MTPSPHPFSGTATPAASGTWRIGLAGWADRILSKGKK